jgi:hypothetical protein
LRVTHRDATMYAFGHVDEGTTVEHEADLVAGTGDRVL